MTCERDVHHNVPSLYLDRTTRQWLCYSCFHKNHPDIEKEAMNETMYAKKPKKNEKPHTPKR